MTWRKSSFSGTHNGDCVEVRWRKRIAVRDSKNTGPNVDFSPSSWCVFVATTRNPTGR